MSDGMGFRRTFSALGVRNFRLYFIGQAISFTGTWMQRVAQSWLVLEMTGSGTAVGWVTSMQFLPILVLAPMGGVVADRTEKRRLLYFTQSLAASTAAILGVLVLADVVRLWMVYALAFALGLVSSFDNPARNALVVEMVGRKALANAIALNSVLVNVARVIGPAVGGFLIVWVGLGVSFLLNAGSYFAFVAALLLIRSEELQKPTPAIRKKGQLREALSYLLTIPLARFVLVMLAVMSLFAYEFEVVLPLMARFTFGGDADAFGVMFAAVGVGAVAGGLYAANRAAVDPAFLLKQITAFGVSLLLAGAAPTFTLVLIALAISGASATSLIATSNSMLQLTSPPEMQGRIIAMWTVAFFGTRPLGAPIVGWLADVLGPRYALHVGGAAMLAMAVVGKAMLSEAGPGYITEKDR